MSGSLSVPHKTLLPEGIRPGTVLKIQGIVPEKANSFYVNLLCSEGEDADAALHFNPRLDTAEVVFNSKQRGSWGTEERGSGVPFRRGVPFEVLLIATDEGFKRAALWGGQGWVSESRVPRRRVLAGGRGPRLATLDPPLVIHPEVRALQQESG
ncbi:Galectin-7 [Tupaia chinensis]|uniref:Galectin n=1 Tax=Tupaia chinensis TaxID=246437 RepID=L8YG09_TUPCH|nr:Galectin-7 [Tupaia chinensis]